MADLFRCDKCNSIHPKTGKRGRLLVQELGENDGMPHPALYNKKLELCDGCFAFFRKSMDEETKETLSFKEASDITSSTILMG